MYTRPMQPLKGWWCWYYPQDMVSIKEARQAIVKSFENTHASFGAGCGLLSVYIIYRPRNTKSALTVNDLIP